MYSADCLRTGSRRLVCRRNSSERTVSTYEYSHSCWIVEYDSRREADS